MKKKSKNEITFEINAYCKYDENTFKVHFNTLFRQIDLIKEKYPNAKIHVRIL